ncbi:MAG TPA: response regulator [Pseudomonadales bacterium]|nr:response regulator [Pseudomonadales bacterium]
MKTEKSTGPGDKRWMLVDDDKGALIFMRTIVSKLGVAHIECFASGEDALAAFKANPGAYEMVITDFQMPGMDGVELSRHLYAIAPKIKILLMTGSHLFNDEVAAREGFSGFLKKPFHPPALQRVLAAIAAGTFSSGQTQK